MVELIGQIAFNGFGNTLVKGDQVFFFEGNVVKGAKDFKVLWEYQHTASPYLLHSFNSYILFQEGDERDIVILDRHGEKKSTISGKYYLHSERSNNNFLLMLEKNGEDWRWVKLYEDLRLEPTRIDATIGNFIIHENYLIDSFALLRCWDAEKEMLLWEKDVTKYRLYQQSSVDVDGGVRDIYISEDILLVAFSEYLAAFRLNDGTLLWEKHYMPSGYHAWGFVENEVLYVLTGSRYFRKIDIRNGDVLLETRHDFNCIHPGNGKKANLWSFKLTNIINAGKYMAGCTKLHNFLFLIDKKNGELVETRRLTGGAFPEIRNPILFVNKKLYVLYMYKDHKELMVFSIDG